MTPISWLAEGNALLLKAIDGLSDAELHEPCGLPGWSRRHLLAHVALNAEALGRLVSWARTGVESRMYSSPEQRTADIETGSGTPVPELRAWVRGSAAALDADLAALSEDAWSASVATAQGRTVPASVIPWLRARETNIHAVDLATSLGFTDLSDGFCTALVGDIVSMRSAAASGPALELSTGEHDWELIGAGEPAQVNLPLPDLAAWLAGRSERPDLPPLPKWL